MVRDFVKKLLSKAGYRIEKIHDTDLEAEFRLIKEKVRAYTMTSESLQYALYKATDYVSSAKLEGDIVECGVWKGGSAMLVALTLSARGDTERQLYLYDTYTGMSEPTSIDVNADNKAAHARWQDLKREDKNEWCYASLEEVRSNVFSTGYPEDKVIFVKGKVEETIPRVIPEKIALLRLDTDWYESNRHELQYLFPRLVPGGVLILDDYGNWQGVRKAVDEYFAEKRISILLNRVDYAGRIAIKA